MTIRICPDCGQQMDEGSTAIACMGGGKSATVYLPPTCTNPACRKQRDNAVIARAVERGVIDP